MLGIKRDERPQSPGPLPLYSQRERLGKCPCRAVTLRGILLQCAQNRHLGWFRQLRTKGPWRWWRLLGLQANQLQDRGCDESDTSGHQSVHDHAQAVDISSGLYISASYLLRSHVFRGSHDSAGGSELGMRLSKDPRNAEVPNICLVP